MPILTDEYGWVLELNVSAYAFGLNRSGRLAHRYWGACLPTLGDYPPPPDPHGWASFNGAGQLTPDEYPAEGGPVYVEPCLKLEFADGVRDLRLHVDHAESRTNDTLDLSLHDLDYPLRVTLHYRLHPTYDLVERSATISNDGDAPISIGRAWSAQWHLPGDGYRLTHLTGRWFDEARIRRDRLPHGLTRLESRRLSSGHHHIPWFALDQGAATETGGEVWFGALAWSGNWTLAAEVTDFNATRVSMGLNDWDFAWRLGPGESFVTPACVAGYSGAGFGGASRRLHDYVRDVLLRDRAPRKVIYNSWEATLFDIDETSQVRLAEIAAAIGVEVFVLDDGWFHGRSSDQAGLGDWWPDERKFPQGLQPLIQRVNQLGMEFGLWIEPEMVNPDSELYRANPDWVLHYPTRPRTPMRNQLMLNLARTDVQNHLIGTFDRLLSDHSISYIKWDMNRNVSEPGWPNAPVEPRELWVRYTQGVYRVWEELRARHPRVTWLSCSGGGGRADLGVLCLADRVQASDNTEAIAVQGILDGFSYYLPSCAIEAWVTDAAAERLSLDFRFHAAMGNILCIGGHLARGTVVQRAQAAALVARFKAIRHIVHLGDRYRLGTPQQDGFWGVQYLAKDRSEGVLFVFRSYLPDPAPLPVLRLQGLDPHARYTVDGFATARSGAAWMQHGLRIDLANFTSTLRLIRRLDHSVPDV